MMLNKEKMFLYFDRIILACLCLLIFCLPFAKAGSETFTWVAIFFWLLKRILGYRAQAIGRMLPETKLNNVLGIFVLANLISVIFSTHFGLSLRGFLGKELKFIIIFFMLVECVNSRRRLKALLSTIVASIILLIVDSAVQYYSGKDFLRGHAWARLTASFTTANGFAAWLIVIIPLFLGLLFAPKIISKRVKFILYPLLGALLICLLMTYARGGWLGFIIGFSLMAGYVFKNFKLKIKILCLFLSAGLLAIFLILPQPIQDKVKAIGRVKFRSSETVNVRIKSTLKTEEGSTPIRFNLWKESLRIIREYPLTGCGLNTYSKVARNYQSFWFGGGYPHNSYLHMAAETGLLGLFAFFWFLFSFFRAGFRYFKKTKDYLILGLLSGILAFLVHAFFDTHLYSLQLVVLFWFMLGLTVAVIKLDS
ncbi:MAG: O-antigen ligase family protein [Candidatus Omnitrophota bacterium]|jgi:putative inorganic carbon (HCO3(-)) transporter